jgi:hypothetical protein
MGKGAQVMAAAPERVEKVYREPAPIREAVLVDGMLENAQLATQAEARAAGRTIEMLDPAR